MTPLASYICISTFMTFSFLTSFENSETSACVLNHRSVNWLLCSVHRAVPHLHTTPGGTQRTPRRERNPPLKIRHSHPELNKHSRFILISHSLCDCVEITLHPSSYITCCSLPIWSFVSNKKKRCRLSLSPDVGKESPWALWRRGGLHTAASQRAPCWERTFIISRLLNPSSNTSGFQSSSRLCIALPALLLTVCCTSWHLMYALIVLRTWLKYLVV